MLHAYEPFFGMTLSPSISGVSHDDKRAVLTVCFEGGSSTELPWPDSLPAELVVRMQGTSGLSLPDFRRLVAGFVPGQPAEEIARLSDTLLRRLARNDMLRWWFGAERQVFCFLDPRSRLFHPAFGALPAPDDVVLSRFAFMRRDGDAILLENPEFHASLTFTAAGQGLLPVVFSRPAPAISPEAAPLHRAFRQFLWCAGFLEHDGSDRPSRLAWAFHERVFHAGSRFFLGPPSPGAGSRLKERVAPLPAQKPAMSDRRIALPRLRDGEEILRSRALNSVMETRRSLRKPGEFPLTLTDLGAFLWRTASVRARLSGGGQELLKRPMPAGGSIHELEFYVAVHRCDGLEPALYHYHGGDHALYALPANPAHVQAMLAGAAGGMGEPDSLPDCLIVMASRLLRLAWKYQGMAYRLSMLHAGVAMEAFYLVAEDMGLSPCAVGSGDSALFAIATGLAEDEEAAIGEFVLNGRQVPAMAGELLQ